jgi:hypothetical protein
MRITEKKKAAQAQLETIQDPGQGFAITISLRRNKTSVRGERDYRRTLKAIITECEQRLGPYRRARG